MFKRLFVAASVATALVGGALAQAADVTDGWTPLLAALDEGRLRKYITDFPAPALIGRKDVILMPHIGASTDEAEENCAVMVAEQVRDYLEHGNVTDEVAAFLHRIVGAQRP